MYVSKLTYVCIYVYVREKKYVHVKLYMCKMYTWIITAVEKKNLVSQH